MLVGGFFWLNAGIASQTLAQAEHRKNEQHNHDQADNIDDITHRALLAYCVSGKIKELFSFEVTPLE